MHIVLIIAGALWLLMWYRLGAGCWKASRAVRQRRPWAAFVLAYAGTACFWVGLTVLVGSVLFAGSAAIASGIAFILIATIPCAYEKFDYQPYKAMRSIALVTCGIVAITGGTLPFWLPVLS